MFFLALQYCGEDTPIVNLNLSETNLKQNVSYALPVGQSSTTFCFDLGIHDKQIYGFFYLESPFPCSISWGNNKIDIDASPRYIGLSYHASALNAKPANRYIRFDYNNVNMNGELLKTSLLFDIENHSYGTLHGAIFSTILMDTVALKPDGDIYDRYSKISYINTNKEIEFHYKTTYENTIYGTVEHLVNGQYEKYNTFKGTEYNLVTFKQSKLVIEMLRYKEPFEIKTKGLQAPFIPDSGYRIVLNNNRDVFKLVVPLQPNSTILPDYDNSDSIRTRNMLIIITSTILALMSLIMLIVMITAIKYPNRWYRVGCREPGCFCCCMHLYPKIVNFYKQHPDHLTRYFCGKDEDKAWIYYLLLSPIFIILSPFIGFYTCYRISGNYIYEEDFEKSMREITKHEETPLNESVISPLQQDYIIDSKQNTQATPYSNSTVENPYN